MFKECEINKVILYLFHAEDDFQTMQLTLLAGKALLGRLKGKDVRWWIM